MGTRRLSSSNQFHASEYGAATMPRTIRPRRVCIRTSTVRMVVRRLSSYCEHAREIGSRGAARIKPWTELLLECGLGHLGQRSPGVTPANVGCGIRNVWVIPCDQPNHRTDSDNRSRGYIANDQRGRPLV